MREITRDELHALAEAVFVADEALYNSPEDPCLLAAYKAAKAAYRAAELPFIGTYFTGDCHRCGGAGGADAWKHTGWTCFDCGGSGKGTYPFRKVRFPADPRTRLRKEAARRVEREDEELAFAKLIDELGPVGTAIAEAEKAVESGEAYESGSRETYFLAGMAAKLRRFGSLTEAQVAAVQRGLDAQAQRVEQEAQAAAAPPLENGRYVLTGEVVSEKSYPSQFGTQFKCLVVLEDGRKVFGSTFLVTDPELLDPAGEPTERYCGRGDKVTFTATVERSADDPKFGFFKRPTKATLVEMEAVS